MPPQSKPTDGPCACEAAAVLDGVNETADIADLLLALPQELRLVRRALTIRHGATLRRYRFTEQQWRVLRIVGQYPGMVWPARIVSARGCFAYTQVTDQLGTLAERELIFPNRPEDYPPDHSRRKRGAIITPSGREMIRVVEARLAKDCADLFARLDADDMALLEKLLERLTLALLWHPDVPREHPFEAEYERLRAKARASGYAAAETKRRARLAGTLPPTRQIRSWGYNAKPMLPPKMRKGFKVGVISDTHGLLRPEAAKLLAGVEHIIHAGDIGNPDVLAGLGRISPVTAVRGNNDTGAWAARIPTRARVELRSRILYVLHDRTELDVDAAAEGIAVVIAGHSHRPTIETIGKVLHLNPGSAGPRRFKLPVTLAILKLNARKVSAEIVELPT